MASHWMEDIKYVEHEGERYALRRSHWEDGQVVDETLRRDVYELRRLAAEGRFRAVLDIGGFTGIFARRAASVLGCPVVSIEPMPENARVLTLNSIGADVRVIQAAVSRSRSSFLSTQFHLAANRLADKGIQVLGISSVEAISAAGGGHGLLVKLDCEGGEVEFLEDALPLLRDSLIVGEWHGSPEGVTKSFSNLGVKVTIGISEGETGYFSAKV